MDGWLFTSVFIILCSIWHWLHFTKAKPAHKNIVTSFPHKKNTSNYHGVTVHECSTACQTVKKLHGKRFLAREVSGLPIYGCTSKNCTCTYIHHADRRSQDDRRYPSIVMKGVFADAEHREKIERREQYFA